MNRILVCQTNVAILCLLLPSLSGVSANSSPVIGPGREVQSRFGCDDGTALEAMYSSSYREGGRRRFYDDSWRWVEDQEGMLHYNRVEGLFVGWRLPHTYDPYREAVDFGLYSEVGYGFKSAAWRYQIGAEFSAFVALPREISYLITLGAEYHDFTGTEDSWVIPQWENSLAAFLFREDYLDFYRRLGPSIYLTQRIGGILQFTGRFTSDEFESLSNGTDWALFGGGDFRFNPPVDEGEINSLRGELRLDTRNGRRSPTRGWLIEGLAERAGDGLEGEYEFQRYFVDVRRYQPLGSYERIDLRVRAGTARGSLPSQYLYSLGGISTLRGYEFKEFTGDRMVLGNLECRIDADRRWGHDWTFGDLLYPLLFLDAGVVWSDEESFSDQEVKASAGVAITSDNGDFRINFAKPLDRGERKIAVSLRVSRTF